MEESLRVGTDDQVPVLDLHERERHDLGDPGAVDEHVHGPELALHVLDEGMHALPVEAVDLAVKVEHILPRECSAESALERSSFRT